jgi:predicted kinase
MKTKNPRLIILRGKPTAGKTTAFHNLEKDKRMKNITFIDFSAIKNKFSKLPDEERRTRGKETLFKILKELIPSKKDILIEEMSKETIEKYLEKEIKKYHYKIIVFQFEISIETAYKRNIQRAKENWHPIMTKPKIEGLHKLHEERFDKEAILINTENLNQKGVVDFIAGKLK